MPPYSTGTKGHHSPAARASACSSLTMSKNGLVPISGSTGFTTSSTKAATRERISRTSSGISKSTMVADTATVDSDCQPSYGDDVTAAASPGLDLDSVDEWIGERLPGAGRGFSALRFGAATGIANALYLIERGAHQWVLRRPPAVKIDPSASNTLREWRILVALEDTAVPHPSPLLLCEDTDVVGAPFLITELVDGFTPGFELPEPFATEPALRYDLGTASVDGCADLSMVDWRRRGLDGLRKPAEFLERQVPRWLAQLD